MKHIWLCIIGLMTAVNMSAQEIHVLPADPAVKSGILPNGMTYYVASNPSLKGMADFALVQRTGFSNVDEADASDIMAHCRSALGARPRILPGTVQDFFVRQGALPGKKGFVEVTEDATIFRFSNIMLAGSDSVVDSTMLVLFDMADRAAYSECESLNRWYAPSDHAVIVSGDVDVNALVEKMKMLSYVIPASKSLGRKEYVWEDRAEVGLCHEAGNVGDVVTISAEWRLQRTPRQYMNTIQPALMERFITQLGMIASDRIAGEFQVSRIPLADVAADYVSAVQTSGDECFRVSLSVRPSDVMFAVGTLASVLGSLDRGDAGIGELKRADRVYLDQHLETYTDNSGYVDRCVSAFVQNSSLASRKSVLAFHASHVLEPDVELNIFNSIAASLLDPQRNITLKCNAPDADMASLAEEFQGAWVKKGDYVPSEALESFDVPLPGEPVKVRSMKKEYMSGGSMWTLANGMRVIFKKMPVDDVIYYSMSLNGGYGNIQNLSRGEGAYLSDYLRFCRIGEARFEDFQDLIRKKGMTMDCEVNLSNTIFKGHVPDDGLDYLLQMLASVLYDRTLDKETFDYQVSCEPLRIDHLRGTTRERITAIDSIMCPDYTYTSCRLSGALTSDFADKAESFMQSQAGRMNDGVLILMGDIDERRLKTALSVQASRFRTSEIRSARPVIRYQPVSGSMLYTLDGEHDSVDMVMSVPMTLTSDNYYTAAIASMVMRKRLSEVVSGKGMYLTLNHRCMKYPQERFNVMITLEEASVDGYAYGTAYNAPMEALKALRAALADIGSVNISKAELDFYKGLLKKHVSVQKETPEYWLKALTMRYLDGKDFSTGCDARIDAVTEEKVRALLSSLKTGTSVEYIINGR